METKLNTIYKIELRKLWKRKDFLSVLAIIGIGILFAISSISDTYTGPANQSCLYWITSQMLNSTILLITPMVCCYAGIRIFASEIDDNNIVLYTQRLRSRWKIYMGKLFSLLTYDIIVFSIGVIINGGLYYLIVKNNASIASGKLLDTNTEMQVYTLLIILISSFILPSLFALMLGSFIRPIPIVGVVFGITILLHNTFKANYFSYFNPNFYIVQFSNIALDTMKRNYDVLKEDYQRLFLFFVISFLYSMIMSGLGLYRWDKKEL